MGCYLRGFHDFVMMGGYFHLQGLFWNHKVLSCMAQKCGKIDTIS